MRKYIIFFAVFFFSSSLLLALTRDDDWYVAKSTHFIVYYKNAPEDFIENLIDKSEDYYNKIADNLGFRRYNFWLWDNRAKIYIYDDSQSYQASVGQPSWSSGCAIVNEKIIHTFPYAKGFFDTTLPHEMGHIIFREFVGFNNAAIPVWLDEGIASYQENLRYSMANRIVKEALGNNKFIDLENLSRLNPHSMLDAESVNLFYAESVSIVDYLVKEFGQDNFILFCQNLRDKMDLEKAISYVYPFKNIGELNRAWQRHLEN